MRSNIGEDSTAMNGLAVSLLVKGKHKAACMMLRNALEVAVQGNNISMNSTFSRCNHYHNHQHKHQQQHKKNRIKASSHPRGVLETVGIQKSSSSTKRRSSYDCAAQAVVMYNRAFVVVSSNNNNNNDNENPVQFHSHSIKAIIFYNMGLCVHNVGVRKGSSKFIQQAIKYYRASLQILEQVSTCLYKEDVYIILALANNMAAIQSSFFFFDLNESKQFLNIMKGILLDMPQYTKSMHHEDLDLFYTNLTLSTHYDPLAVAPAA